MKYKVSYSCVSHVGKCRKINQDNFICDSRYSDGESDSFIVPITGCIANGQSAILGVFDGMGGEKCGEIAALLAAREASQLICTGDPIKDLLLFCKKANEKIVCYAEQNTIGTMGTTAAILEFTDKAIGLCNIGDSKIFQFIDKQLEQISVDHVAMGVYGMKPPLSQNLGISPSDMIIEPYVAKGRYHDGDIYLMCSDGLTDMISISMIQDILLNKKFDDVTGELLEVALENGGKYNITIILCKVERERGSIFRTFLNLSEKKRKGKKCS